MRADHATTPHDTVAAVLLIVVGVALVVSSAWWTLIPTAGLVTIVAWLRIHGRTQSSVWVTAVSWAAVGVVSAISFGLVWPIPQLIGLTIAALVLRRQGVSRPAWLGPGVWDRPALALAIASVPLTTVALVLFIASGRTDLEVATESLQSLPTWVLPLAGLGFVVANPTVEEVLFRGLLQTMVTDVFGRPVVSIVVQGLAFGAIHFAGVPGGPLGMAMASIWGVALGVVRHRTGSIRIPWIVHALANATIYITVVLLALRDNLI